MLAYPEVYSRLYSRFRFAVQSGLWPGAQCGPGHHCAKVSGDASADASAAWKSNDTM